MTSTNKVPETARASATEIVEAAISECYETTPSPLAEGTQQLEQVWYMPRWGCDTLDQLRDHLIYSIARALTEAQPVEKEYEKKENT